MSTLAQIKKKYLGCNDVKRRELVKFVLGRICNKTSSLFIFSEPHKKLLSLLMCSSFLGRLIHNVNNAILNTKCSKYIHLALLANVTV